MNSATPLRIGTRGSALALVQAGIVRDGLESLGEPAVLQVIETEGDRRAPDTAWGEGAFVGAIEGALLDGRVDVAVHSAKDVPTDEDPRLEIAAYLIRADARDVLVLRAGSGVCRLDAIPYGARVGTDSPRRTAFLRAARPDLSVHPLHGNVDTRLRRLDAKETDVLVLAAAGLQRLGRSERIDVMLEPHVLPPAPGQGALAVQVRAADTRSLAAVRGLDHPPTRAAVELERGVLAASGGGCRAPLGVLAFLAGGGTTIHAGYARFEGDLVAHAHVDAGRGDGADGAALVGRTLAALAADAADQAAARGWPRVIVTRAADQAGSTVLSLVDAGLAPIVVPGIAVELLPASLETAVRDLSGFDWVVLTSANAVRALRLAAARAGVDLRGAASGGRPRWAVIGRATRRELGWAGVRPDFQPEPGAEEARTLGERLPTAPGERVLIPRSSLAAEDLPAALAARGATVESVVAYRTALAPESGRRALERALDAAPGAIVFASPSAVRGIVRLADAAPEQVRLRRLPAVVIGRTTAAAARDAGFTEVAVASTPGAADVAATTARVLGALLETR